MDEDEWDAYEEELDWAASAGLPPPPVRPPFPSLLQKPNAVCFLH